MSYQTIITLRENLTQTKLKYYTESASEVTIRKNLLKTFIRKLNGRLTIILFFHKMIYTPLHGKQNLVDTYLTFLSYMLTLTQGILMKETHRDRILSLSRAPFLMIQAIVKTGKFAKLPTQLYYKLLTRHPMVKVKILRPLQTYNITILRRKYLSQRRTLKLHMNLRNKHRRVRVTILQLLKTTILLAKLFRKTNLVIV